MVFNYIIKAFYTKVELFLAEETIHETKPSFEPFNEMTVPSGGLSGVTTDEPFDHKDYEVDSKTLKPTDSLFDNEIDELIKTTAKSWNISDQKLLGIIHF